jgi:two-component system chemotaxis response regulator CheY
MSESDNRKLAMVIDDSRAMRGILKRILLPLGFEVREAGNGRDALDQLWNEDLHPQLALIDWNMPEMNGLEFVVAVRKQKHLRQMTLMMVTTESEQGQIVRALAAGAHEYVIKPFTAEAIIEKLAYMGLADVPVPVPVPASA